jgi:hypothetical protein
MGASSSSAVDDTGSADGHVIIGSNADGGSKETGCRCVDKKRS